jgi:hypothetical protein
MSTNRSIIILRETAQRKRNKPAGGSGGNPDGATRDIDMPGPKTCTRKTRAVGEAHTT